MANLLDELRRLLADRYRVERELGRGGMATVFLAEDTRYARMVAVKVIRPEVAYTVGVERFLREIRFAARLTHPHIVPVYDSGDTGGITYYVMPYVHGESLRVRLSRLRRLDVDTAVRITREIASALAYAHSQHVIHRDIKPENVLLADEHAYVTDFGVARAIGEMSPESITAPGIAVGTPVYMSPEQASGERQLDGRSDVYSLGCVLYEMLVGEPPYAGPTTHAIVARCFAEPTPSARDRRPEVPLYVDDALTRALAKFAVDRFPSAAEFASALATRRVLPAPPARSVAVVPFENQSAERDDQYLGDGVAEEIISHLAKLKGIRVAARTSSFAYRGPALDPRVVGDALGVEAVLLGRVRRVDRQLRVSVELTSASDGRLLWAEHFDREMQDVFAIEDEIAEAVVTTLKGHLAVEPHERVVRRYTESVDAFELYLRGRYAGQTRRRRGLLEGVAYFEQAIAADPHYALAYAGLADSYSLLAWYRFMAPREAFPKANVAAARALECDEMLPQAHASAGVVRFFYDWDWSGTERALSRALDLRPDEPTALHAYGEYLIARNRLPEALEHAERALVAEPWSLNINAGLGWVHYFMRDYDRAVDRFQQTLKLDPDYVFLHWFLGQAYLAAGEVDRAVETLRTGVQMSGGHPGMMAYLGQACARKGMESDALGVLDVLRSQASSAYVPADYFAVVHLGLGTYDAALAWLERARQERALHLVFLGVDPVFDGLRDDPRFTDILRSVGLT